MHHSSFTVAGMSSSTSGHHNPNLNTWGTASSGGSLTAPFTDSLSQSRSHYQPGYLMSASQSNNAPQGNQRIDEAPIVQTKAKMNHVLSQGSVSEFGIDSMFQSKRQRQNLADEDAPPTTSVNDIPNEIFRDTKPPQFQQRNSSLEVSQYSKRHTRAPSAPQSSQPLYVIVFGYPADKFSVTVEYFRSFGDSTEADPNIEIVNCFRIGYRDAGDAMRAVRKNGEVLGGSWMIGVKWADPVQAEALLGQPVLRVGLSSPLTEPSPTGNAMAVDEPSHYHSNSHTPTVGTPIRLVPAASAYRKTGTISKGTTPQQPKGNPVVNESAPVMSSATTQSKGVLGQMSDLIFGW